MRMHVSTRDDALRVST